MAFKAGLLDGSPFEFSVKKREPKDYQELLARAQKYIRAESEPTQDQASGSGGQPSNDGNQSKKRKCGDKSRSAQNQSNSNQPAPQKEQERNKKPRPERRPFSGRYETYTLMTTDSRTIYLASKDEVHFRPPRKLCQDASRRHPGKFCELHKQTGHTTLECYELRDEIEALVCEGKLQQYKASNQNAPPQAEYNVIHTISGGVYAGGSSRRAHRNWARISRDPLPSRHEAMVVATTQQRFGVTPTNITFNDADAHGIHHLHTDALVIQAMVGNHTVCRILVDEGSSVDILYRDAFSKMGFTANDLRTYIEPLYRFSGESMVPADVINLPTTVGIAPLQSTVQTT